MWRATAPGRSCNDLGSAPGLEALRALAEPLRQFIAERVFPVRREMAKSVGGEIERIDANPHRQERLRNLLRHNARAIGAPLAVIALVILFSAMSPVFLKVENFRNIGIAAAALAAVSFGQTFTILTAGLDLSVGSTVALVSVIAAFGMRSQGIAVGIIEGLIAGAAVGLVNGIVITRLKVFPFIATLAMLSIMSGLALSLSGGVAVTGVPGAFADLAYELVLGVPVPVIIALLVLLTAFIVLKYTRLGRRIYAVGGNEEAARLSGVRIGAIQSAAYVFSGL